jgi:hypothetical protein
MKPETRKEIDKVLNVPREPDPELSPIIKNNIKRKKSKDTYSTYRITIPKKFVDKIHIDSEKQIFVFYLLNKGTPKKPQYELTAKLVQKDDPKIQSI